MKYWGRTPTQNWGEIQNKPTILQDNKIHWNEIEGIPPRINFLATNIPGNWQPWVLSDFYSQRIEWLPLTSSPNPWTMVQRGAIGEIHATSFTGTGIPTEPNGLALGRFYRDSGGFLKIVI